MDKPVYVILLFLFISLSLFTKCLEALEQENSVESIATVISILQSSIATDLSTRSNAVVPTFPENFTSVEWSGLDHSTSSTTAVLNIIL